MTGTSHINRVITTFTTQQKDEAELSTSNKLIMAGHYRWEPKNIRKAPLVGNVPTDKPAHQELIQKITCHKRSV